MAPDDDDFWGTGEEVRVDDEGRLVYASVVELVEGPGPNVQFGVNRGGNLDPATVYIDPVTGRPVLLQQGGWRRVPGTVVRAPAQGPVSNAPRVSAPRPAAGSIPTPAMPRAGGGVVRRDR